MGYIKHNAIIVTGDIENISKARQKAKKIFESHEANASRIVGEVIHGICNGQCSFFIAPDGSKEGWSTSDNMDKARKEFLDWLKYSKNYCEYIEVLFGGDDELETITRSRDTDFK